MAAESLFQRLSSAEGKLSKSVEKAENAHLAVINEQRSKIRKRAKEMLEETPEMKLARENIERLQLRLELLRNIKMNWRGFQAGLTRKGMKMRINQHAHLEHLISFLESGHGVPVAGMDEVDMPSSREQSLMTFEIQPTGAGKTGAFAIDIALMDVPSLTLVPFDSLLDQTKNDMIKIGNIPEDQIGIVGGGSKEIGRKHTIATYAGHAAQMRKGQEYEHFMKTQCKLVICDEVHHQALGDRMQESIREIDTLGNGNPTEEEMEMLEAERDVVTHLAEQTGVKSLKIGFTATPRGSQKHVQQYFPHCLGRVYHREMVEAGLVVPYRIIQCDGSVFAGELDGYLTQDKEIEILNREGIYGKLAGEYANVLSEYRSRKHKSEEIFLYGMAFCTSHSECEKFVKEAESHGLKCQILTGKEAKGRAGQVVINTAVDNLTKGELDLIVTVEKLATGFNRPEINAIISARITSAAKTIQYVGRGGRSHTDIDGHAKEHCLVFETHWTLKKNGKRGKKPLRLADALAFNGEDPEAICSMANGSALDIQRTYELEKDGTVDIGGRLAIGVVPYVKAQIKSILGHQALLKLIDANALKPIENIRVLSAKHPIDAYWKDEIDALLPQKLDSQGVALLNTEKGKREAVGLTAYALAHKLMRPQVLSQLIAKAKLLPIPGAIARSGNQSVPVYWKDEVDALLPQKINDQGIVFLSTGKGLRAAVSLSPYADAHSLNRWKVAQLVEKGNLKPVPNVEVWSGKKRITVYWRDDVETILRVNGHL